MSQAFQKLIAILACVAILGVVILLQKPESTPEADKAPLARWVFEKASADGKTIADLKEKFPITLRGKPHFITSPTPAIELKGEESLTIKAKQPGDDPNLPKEAISISGWVRVDRGQKYGGILGCMQDNGDFQKGFVLGHDETRFTFSLVGSENKKAKLTTLVAKTAFVPGKWYHVAATYDSKTMRIFVNGKEENSSTEQAGPIAYAPFAPFVVGAYKDDDEDYPMLGAIKELQLDKRALSEKEIFELFEANKNLVNAPVAAIPPRFVVEPYLQYPTRESIIIMWETTEASDSTISYGLTDATMKNLTVEEKVTMHEVKIKDLQANTRYVYKVTSKDAEGKIIQSDLRQFMTAVDEDSAFSFAVIGDTQKNPKMTAQIARMMYDRRPHFVIHVGDVVDNGPDNKEWENELFRPCAQLFSRVAVFPTIGNHEKNHANYYKYFSLPAPEYYYRYHYGNADFFVLDSNKTLKPESEQYKWLDAELGKSTAKWKFCYHHHPVWTSDEDDYGNSNKGLSRMGDLNARNLMTLYEKYNVDICFNGHIHAYERSWPVRDGKVNREKGTIYITSGGGGGKLEGFAPLPNWFKAQCKVDFHYCFITMQGNRFEMKVYDQNGNMFDFLDLQK